uniref:Uncharacterized protein n=1 Tax=Anopheles atroparvus TaxID=41427 RepID=A0AAG5CNU8_ANOAO
MASAQKNAQSNIQHAHPEQFHPDLYRLRGENDRHYAQSLLRRKADQRTRVHLAMHAGDDLSHFTRRESPRTRRQAGVH